MTGWIKLHRKIIESELYPKSREFTKYEAWLDLLMVANHSEKTTIVGNEVLSCKRGQSIRSVESYQKRWNWTRAQVRCFFDLLEKLKMISREATSKTTILSICNYDTYQGEQPTDNQQENGTDNSHQNSQQTTRKTANITVCEIGNYNNKQPTDNQHYSQQNNHKQEVKNNKNNISVIFDLFRTEYPGTKRGLKTELENFLKKNNPETVELLLPALNKEKQHHETLKETGQFVPQWKNLSTWINQRCWEQEFPQIKPAGKVQITNQKEVSG